jgi:hypothetical protein
MAWDLLRIFKISVTWEIQLRKKICLVAELRLII